ncbi:MAG: flavodoxin domain-containing protein [Tissierellia bacterium]|nr:flavodoxin domain-containing protein [Tissierellia bacterium]
MKANIIFFTTSGNTEAMADTLKSSLEAKGYDVSIFNDEQGEDFADADLLLFGSPAQGTEEVDDTVIMPTIDKLDLNGKKVFMFGSYGWGGGEYMENWKEIMKDKGAILAAEPVVCLEAPDDSVDEELKAAVENF